MPNTFLWMFALLAVLFFVARRFLRRSTTLAAYKNQQAERLKQMWEENSQSAVFLDEEALTPVLSALRDVPLPPEMTLHTQILRHGARVWVGKGDAIVLDMMLSYSCMAPPHGSILGQGKFLNGAWHLRLDYQCKSGQDAEAHPKGRQAVTNESTNESMGTLTDDSDFADEYFDNLATFATRVENLTRSLHDRPL